MRNFLLLASTFVYVGFICLSAAADTVWVPPGPIVGETFPNPLQLQDQSGNKQNLQVLMGKQGIALFFVRSADWCPYCKRQLVDVNHRLKEFQELGLNVVTVSKDTVEKINTFYQKQSIAYTMLSDADGAIVESLGIRDPQYGNDSAAYGVARPMIFILDPQLKIIHKFAEESYRNRPDLDMVLAAIRNDS